MSSEITKILDDLAQRFGVAIDWTSQNVVPYLQDLSTKIVNHELFTSIVWIIISLTPIFVFFKMYLRAKKNGFDKTFMDEEDDDISLYGISFLIVCLLSVISFIIIISQVFDIITCLVFPEKVIFEFLKSSKLI